MDLNTAWFALIGILFAGYAVLDGFDLGVGVLHFFSRDEHERRVSVNAIGPVWDANEVWLLGGGAALFAAFPAVYAAVFSGFYLAFMLLLLALIARAVALEFRGKVDHPGWRKAWDLAFSLGSLLPAVLLGVAAGNILRGLPVTAEGTFRVALPGLLNPYAILFGLLTLALFVTHGAAYLALKTEGDLRDRMGRWLLRGWIASAALGALVAIATIFVSPSLFQGRLGSPFFWIAALVLLAAVAGVPLSARAGRYGRAFLASGATIVMIVVLAGSGLFPRMVPSTLDPAHSLTAYNAASSPRTMTAMLVIAALGLPLVIAYTAWIYRVFRGKVVLTEDSY